MQCDRLQLTASIYRSWTQLFNLHGSGADIEDSREIHHASAVGSAKVVSINLFVGLRAIVLHLFKMSHEGGKSYICSDVCTLSIIPMSAMTLSFTSGTTSEFQSKIKFVVPKAVSDDVSEKLRQNQNFSASAQNKSCRNYSMSINQHVSESKKKGRVKAEAWRTTQMSSIDLRVWDPKRSP